MALSAQIYTIIIQIWHCFTTSSAPHLTADQPVEQHKQKKRIYLNAKSKQDLSCYVDSMDLLEQPQVVCTIKVLHQLFLGGIFLIGGELYGITRKIEVCVFAISLSILNQF